METKEKNIFFETYICSRAKSLVPGAKILTWLMLCYLVHSVKKNENSKGALILMKMKYGFFTNFVFLTKIGPNVPGQFACLCKKVTKMKSLKITKKYF